MSNPHKFTNLAHRTVNSPCLEGNATLSRVVLVARAPSGARLTVAKATRPLAMAALRQICRDCGFPISATLTTARIKR